MSVFSPARPRAVAALLAILLALPLLGIVPAAEQAAAQPTIVAGAPLAPADGVPDATIRRTSFGIPHIVARDWTSLGFGHGYATAEGSICNLADTLVTARGERSRFFGPEGRYTDQVTLDASNLQIDAFVTALRDRGTVEALMENPDAAPSDRIVAIIDGYVEGVNRYLADIGGAAGIEDPECAGGEWVRPAEPLDLFYGIYLANELASAGVFVPQIVEATPPSADDPGTPVDPGVLGLPLPLPPGEFSQVSDAAGIDAAALRAGLGKADDAPFGSNGTALGGDVTDTGMGMVLGNPHFPWKGRYRFHQAQLTIPGAYDVAGSGLVGSPVINIGWNNNVAWTHTVSTAYRFTPYEHRLAGPTTVVTESGPVELERQEVTVEVLNEDGTVEEVTEDLYRSPVGWVLDAPNLLMGWSAASVWSFRDANGEHLRTLDVFLRFGEADTVQELLDMHTETGGLPWVNTMAADRNGDALYADHSVVPHVTDAQVQSCATPVGLVLLELAGLPGLDGTRAEGDCAWGTDEDAARAGIFGFENLPHTITRDWVINANDSYWLPNPETPLEGFAGIIGCEQCERSLRTRMVYRYVMDRLDGSDGFGGPNEFTIEQLRDVQVENRVFAAELARMNDDLQTACAESGVREEACQALAAWDGRTNTDSRGAILFREFWTRGGNVFVNGFDATDPVGTPNDLDEGNADVQQAIVDAVAFMDEAGIPLDAPLGEHQVAADDRVTLESRIPIHGGIGGTGSADVISERNRLDEAGTDGAAYFEVGYGSSHIQAVAFTPDGVDASTIATYSNASDPTSPHSTDQTRLWSAEEWVEWPYTEAQQLASPGFHAYRVSADTPREDLADPTVTRDPGLADDVTADPGLRVERVSGPTRIETAVAVSRRTFATADAAVIAPAGEIIDGLIGAPVAGALDGPLLLSPPGALPDDVLAELDRLGVAEVVLLGTEAALSPELAAQLTASGRTVQRVAGEDRAATARAAADLVDPSPLVFVVNADAFADALSVAGLAAALEAPIVIVERDDIPTATRSLLTGRERVIVAGGPAVISDAVVAEIGTIAPDVTRAAGSDRYATSAAIAALALELGLSRDGIWLATGELGADAVGAGPAAGRLGSVVLLVNPFVGTLEGALATVPGLDVATVLVAGGTAAVPASVLE